MLVLSRKQGQIIEIGENIKIEVLKLKGGNVRIGVDAPQEVAIRRGELDDLPGDAVAIPPSTPPQRPLQGYLPAAA